MEDVKRGRPPINAGRVVEQGELTGIQSAGRTVDKFADLWNESSVRVEKIGEVDKYYVDPKLIPDGYVVEWKRHEILGKPDKDNVIAMSHGQWKPYPASFYAELGGVVPYKTDSDIIDDGNGNVLMIRPLRFQEQAKNELYKRANAQMGQYDQIAGGELDKIVKYSGADSVRTRVDNYSRSTSVVAVPN
jgi:hypothetical protein